MSEEQCIEYVFNKNKKALEDSFDLALKNNKYKTDWEKKCIELEQQLQAYKDKEDKLRELLGNYKHYSSPTEEQLNENEIIVYNAYKILNEGGDK